MDDSRLIRPGQLERPRCGGRTLGEQENGFVLPELGKRFAAVSRRKPKWRHRDNVLTLHLQRLPRRRHHPHVGRSAKEVGHQTGGGPAHMLTVVKDQQSLTLA